MKKTQNLPDYLIDEDNAEIEKQLKNSPLYKHTTKDAYWEYKDYPNSRHETFNDFLKYLLQTHITERMKKRAIEFYLNCGLEYPLQPNYSETREVALLIHTGCRFAKSYLLKTGLSSKQIDLIPELKISNVNEKYRNEHGIDDDFYSKYDEGRFDDNNDDDDIEQSNEEQEEIDDDQEQVEEEEEETLHEQNEEEDEEKGMNETFLTITEKEENRRNNKQVSLIKESCEEILWQSFFCHKNNKIHCFDRLMYNDRITNLYRK